ncbi:MAG: disulfide bond formation protein DsbA [Proteobacteria bacterium SG_bin9]|nr:MAG: disulfide bond formation protein DsbA [Proteobacteria bacterium SG_bin9]
MMTKLEYHFDYGSPNCYLSHRVIPHIEKRTGVKFEYVPILLGGVFKSTNNQSPMMAFKDVRNKLMYQQAETRRFVARHGLAKFAMNSHFPVNTLQIMRGTCGLVGKPDFMKYVEVLSCAMWEDSKKMDDPEVITATLDAAGLDGKGFMALTQDANAKALLLSNTEKSVARGTFGAPTFFVDGEIYFGKDTLDEIERVIGAAKAA